MYGTKPLTEGILLRKAIQRMKCCERNVGLYLLKKLHRVHKIFYLDVQILLSLKQFPH